MAGIRRPAFAAGPEKVSRLSISMVAEVTDGVRERPSHRQNRIDQARCEIFIGVGIAESIASPLFSPLNRYLR
jgi:hypothetical protein